MSVIGLPCQISQATAPCVRRRTQSDHQSPGTQESAGGGKGQCGGGEYWLFECA
jgi:hypothetical protein